MDELADYTDYQFAVKLQIEIEQLTKNKQAQERPKAYLLGGQPVQVAVVQRRLKRRVQVVVVQ